MIDETTAMKRRALVSRSTLELELLLGVAVGRSRYDRRALYGYVRLSLGWGLSRDLPGSTPGLCGVVAAAGSFVSSHEIVVGLRGLVAPSQKIVGVAADPLVH